MSQPSVLFIGGTGVISTACVREAMRQGREVTLLNRGETTHRSVPDAAEVLQADVRDAASVRSALGQREFDTVVSFLSFTPEHVQQDVDLFSGRAGQYVFISSASAYQTPPARLPVTESTPLRNPYWEYSRNKIACEDLLVREYRERAFPMTIVRPSHTYDPTLVPFDGGWTVVERMRRGRAVGRQVQLHGVRQQQGQGPGPGMVGRGPVPAGGARDRRLARRGPGTARGRPPPGRALRPARRGLPAQAAGLSLRTPGERRRVLRARTDPDEVGQHAGQGRDP